MENEGKFSKLDEIFTSHIEKERNFYKILLQNKRFLRGVDLICDKKEIGKFLFFLNEFFFFNVLFSHFFCIYFKNNYNH